jgi:hypothetical protein
METTTDQESVSKGPALALGARSRVDYLTVRYIPQSITAGAKLRQIQGICFAAAGMSI